MKDANLKKNRNLNQLLSMTETKAPEIRVKAGAITKVRNRNLPNLTATKNSVQWLTT